MGIGIDWNTVEYDKAHNGCSLDRVCTFTALYWRLIVASIYLITYFGFNIKLICYPDVEPIPSTKNNLP